MTAPGAIALQSRLAEALTALLAAAGWTVDVAYPIPPGEFLLAAFRKPLTPDFAATAQFHRVSEDGQQLVVGAAVGLSYQPAYRLWPLVDDRERSELQVEIGELSHPDQEELRVPVAHDGQIEAAARTLVGAVVEHAVGYAEAHADLDRLLEEVAAESEDDFEVVPVLLAASGRHDEARRALADYEASGEADVRSMQYRRFRYQLTRWLEAGGVLPEAPTGPLDDPSARVDLDFARVSPADQQARREAVRAVLRARPSGDRNRLRTELVAELGRRGITEGPMWVEGQLDHLETGRQPLGQARLTLRGLKMLAQLGGGMKRMLQAPGSAQPEWLLPPPRASYPAGFGPADTMVDLDAGVAPYLDQVLAAIAFRVGNQVSVDAWLAWDPDPRTPDSRLAVHIGSLRVGVLDATATARREPLMAAAGRREEWPCVKGRLLKVHDDPPYLLALALAR